ncbi:hypothetical protein Dda3937_04637 [Dickeya dadantii 3937]|uniref:Uncharacterized protein n=1 Tax=Dickeya dadantii (strain 3937) TaxID=198628 RepID=E0SIP6_DICD3|nr:hypothetical protein Dda3937_04637 [Dickeya dadantii 3937]
MFQTWMSGRLSQETEVFPFKSVAHSSPQIRSYFLWCRQAVIKEFAIYKPMLFRSAAQPFSDRTFRRIFMLFRTVHWGRRCCLNIHLYGNKGKSRAGSNARSGGYAIAMGLPRRQ